MADLDGNTYLRTRHLEAEHLLLDFGVIVAELHGESAPGQARRGLILVKQGGMSLVLSYLRAGGTMQQYAAPGVATVQVGDGYVEIGNESLDVPAGRFVAFNSSVRSGECGLRDA